MDYAEFASTSGKQITKKRVKVKSGETEIACLPPLHKDKREEVDALSSIEQFVVKPWPITETKRYIGERHPIALEIPEGPTAIASKL